MVLTLEQLDVPSAIPVPDVGRDYWSGNFIDLRGAQDADDVFRMAPELDFEVIKAPLAAQIMVADTDEDGNTYEERGSAPVPGYVATLRTDTNEVLGVVSESWQNYQNRELTDFAEALRGEAEAPYSRALLLYGGRIVALELSLGEGQFIPGDPSPWANIVLIYTGHDGRHALTVQRVKRRISCANQFSGTTREAIATFKVRHTKNMSVNIRDVYAALNMVAQFDRSFEEAMADLVKREMTLEGAQRFAEDLLPIPDDIDNPIRTIKARDSIVDLFSSSKTLEGVGFNAYRAFHAVGEYVDHYRTYRTSKYGSAFDSRAASIIEGSAQGLKDRALTLLTSA